MRLGLAARKQSLSTKSASRFAIVRLAAVRESVKPSGLAARPSVTARRLQTLPLVPVERVPRVIDEIAEPNTSHVLLSAVASGKPSASARKLAEGSRRPASERSLSW